MYKITLDGSYLYHPWIRGRCITEGALTQEVNKNGSCDVSIVLDHPLAASVLRRKSMLEVIRFGLTGSEKTIYRGVVMNTVEDRDLEMEIQTEGDLVFFRTASSVHSTRPARMYRERQRQEIISSGWLRSTTNRWMISSSS